MQTLFFPRRVSLITFTFAVALAVQNKYLAVRLHTSLHYHLFSRTKYSFVYYGFPTAAHAAVFVGGGITKNKFGLYYEFGTTDRDLVSYASNPKAINFFEIINIGVGALISLR